MSDTDYEKNVNYTGNREVPKSEAHDIYGDIGTADEMGYVKRG